MTTYRELKRLDLPDDINRGGLETLRAHRRHERIGLFIEHLLSKYGKMTARQLVTAYIDEKWPFKTAKPSVDANQVSKLIKKRPNIIAEPKGDLLAYRIREPSEQSRRGAAGHGPIEHDSERALRPGTSIL